MYNLYQSQLRKDIKTKVYNKPNFTVDLFGKEYFGLIKEKKVGPITLKWYQIMGIELPEDKDYVKSELKKLKSKYKNKKGSILFQLGIINEFTRFENAGKKDPEFISDIKTQRLSICDKIKKDYGLPIAFRENMPQSNIIYDVTKSDEELLQDMDSNSRSKTKKAIKNDVSFRVAKPSEYEEFYVKWKELAGHKGFNIIPYDQYKRLVNYIIDNKRGGLFVSELDGEVLAGSIFLYDYKSLIYLYGFGNSTNKKLRNLGGHHFLKFKIMGYAREQGFEYVDMMGGAPTGFDDHSLVGVSRFKEGLGGFKTEQYGSYDLVLNKLLYWLFKLQYKLRK